MTRVALLHAYSADNSGDKLLVDLSLALVREALGAHLEVEVVASYPDSFGYLGVPVSPARPSVTSGLLPLRRLRARLEEMDLLVGVGGGYLRAAGGSASAKCAAVMLPQLLAAGRSSAPAIYLPQSVGPFRGAVGRALRTAIRRVDKLYVRDDRSLVELRETPAERLPDLAVLGLTRPSPTAGILDATPVMNARAYRGEVLPHLVGVLRRELGSVDAVEQSRVGGNDDAASTKLLSPRAVIDRNALYTPSRATGALRRVVVAMRLHAAVQAINAGHYVIHLAYERKGYGAFADLGLDAYVHPVGRFEPHQVATQVRRLIEDATARTEYDEAIAATAGRRAEGRAALLSTIARAVGSRSA